MIKNILITKEFDNIFTLNSPSLLLNNLPDLIIIKPDLHLYKSIKLDISNNIYSFQFPFQEYITILILIILIHHQVHLNFNFII